MVLAGVCGWGALLGLMVVVLGHLAGDSVLDLFLLFVSLHYLHCPILLV